MDLRRVLLSLLCLAVAGPVAAECVGWEGFGTPARYPSSAVQSVLVRDLDGDGAPDLALSGNQVDQQAAFSLFRNRGDGTFEAERLIASGAGERLEDTGDLDGDGIPDLVASNYWANGIAVYRGKGALTFDTEVPYGTATHGGPSVIADYDRDGVDDVITLSFGSGNPVRVHLFRGNGDGTLAPKKTFDTSLANGASLSIRRINGSLELLVSEHSAHLGLIRYRDGAISVSKIAAGPGLDLSSAFADVDGDGIADIIDTAEVEGPAGFPAREPIFVTLGNADGSFRERKQLAATSKLEFPVAVRVADFDGDARADLVVIDFRKAALFFLRGDGTGNFDAGVPFDVGGPVNAFAVGDLNRDSAPDLVTANDDHTVSVLMNRGPCPRPRRRAARH